MPDPARAARAWALLGGGFVVFLLGLWGFTRLLFGGGEAVTSYATGPTGPNGAGGASFAPPPPEGSVTETFPIAALGTRLELKVVALGDHPGVCHAEGLLISADVRSVYHHGCDDAEEIDRAYFLVELTNLTDSRVPLELDRFTVVDVDGSSHETLPVPPVGAPTSRFFPPSLTLGPGTGVKRWVTIDGTDGARPERLVYLDGEETLTVRFRGDWV